MAGLGAVLPSDGDSYREDIERFIFRNETGLTIPKSWRELAYSQQIDVIITSISKEEYLSYKSNPANGFYGYAVLVYRDMCEIQIPINFPRQRLYYGTVPQAYVNRRAVIDHHQTREMIGSIEGAGSFDCAVQLAWEELPIRELYIKCFNGTQFEIELSRFRPLPLLLGDCTFDGKSNMNDGDKDFGLPQSGIAPNKASDPNNPFAGLPPATTIEDLGDFFNNKKESLNLVDPNNLPTPLDANGNPLNFTGGQCLGENKGYWFYIDRFFNPDLQQEFVNNNAVPFGNGTQLPVGVQVIAVDTILISGRTKWRVFLSNGTLRVIDEFGGSNASSPILITDYDVSVDYYDYATDTILPDQCGNYRPFETN